MTTDLERRKAWYPGFRRLLHPILGELGSPSVNVSLAPHQEKTTSKQRHCSKGRRMRRSAPDSGVFKKPLPFGPKQRQEEEAGQRSQGRLRHARALLACWTFKEPTGPSAKRWVESNVPAAARCLGKVERGAGSHCGPRIITTKADPCPPAPGHGQGAWTLLIQNDLFPFCRDHFPT